MLIKIKLLKYSNRHVASQTFYVPDDMPPEVFQEILRFIDRKAKECEADVASKKSDK